MIYVITSDKGGVGKTTTAISIASILSDAGKKFKLIEIDNSNNSLLFKNSKVLNQEDIKSVKLSQKDIIVSDMLFDLMSNPKMDYIVDIGGGDDTKPVIQKLKKINLTKTWVIPVTRIKKYLANAVNTHQLIDEKDNCVFCLNMYTNFENIQNEFVHFFGNEKLGIKQYSSIFKNSKIIGIPFSHHFELASDDEQTILDVAKISIEKSEDEARTEFFALSKSDREKFNKMMMLYWRSEEAASVFNEIKQNCSILIKKTNKEA